MEDKMVRIVKDFPSLYEGFYKRPKDGEPWQPIAFGISCGTGWFNIIYDLSKKIAEKYPDVRVLQVKEKFGGLRYYVGPANEEVFAWIDAAEAESFKTCESCGTKEDVKTDAWNGRWVRTLCPNCVL